MVGNIVLYTHPKNLENPCSRFGEKAKKVKKHNFGHLIPCNPGLRIFQKNHLAQTIRTIVLYTHAKIGKILRAVFKKRPKIIKQTD